jgi:hypothetical protein
MEIGKIVKVGLGIDVEYATYLLGQELVAAV